MNQHEIERIAAALHQARPDWPIKQLQTLLAEKLADRPRRDVFVALAWVACESGTASPYRVLETGPWWKAAGVEGNHTTGVRNVWPDVAHRCRTCSQDRAGHDRLNANTPPDETHPWETKRGDLRLPADQAHAVVGELRDHKRADPPPRPEPDVGTPTTTRVQPVRTAIAARKEDA